MKIHGLRIYHRNLLRIFGPVAAAWQGHTFANDFGVIFNADGTLQDPLPGLRARFGSGLLAADVKRQLMLLRGDDFCSWASAASTEEGALLPIFREPPTFELLQQLYWGRDFRLTSATWPVGMRALLHLWDGQFWQLFTTEQSVVIAVIRAHAADPKLKMYFVELEREYPDPSNEELQVATCPGDGSDHSRVS